MSKDEYARAVIAEGRRRGVTVRGIVIALATTLVESNLIMYANAADPETLAFFHEALSTDSKSSGLYQQQPPWWGSAADRMDATRSSGLFYSALIKLDYNNPGVSAGTYAQRVQGSAYPLRYDQRMGDAQALYDRLATSPPEVPPVTNKPNYTELNRIGNSSQGRNGSRITNFLLHTQEGDGTAESLAAYLNNPNNDASYHYTVRDGIVCDVVDTDQASWSVLAANPFTINLCFAGSRAAWGRDEWLRIEGDIAIAAWVAVQDCHRYGFSTEVIAPPYHRADGISDHRYVTQCLGIGTHTDVGNGFPWDVFTNYVRSFADGPVAPPVNKIDEIAAASPWLGARKTVGEVTCPDGVGRFAEFANGFVYWTPATGARPIPANIFETWAALGYETSPLGYPVAYHTVLPVDGDPKVGDVQAFQGGTVYRKYGQNGFYVHGLLGDRWAAAGFERGPLGWPTGNETEIPGGRYQDFEHGRAYWVPGNFITLRPGDGPDVAV